jgi:hypothetical protein
MTETNSKPYVSLVVAARNDNHGGNMLARMQAFLDAWLGQAKRYDLASEVIVVEWNPPLNRPKLFEVLQLPREPQPCDVRFIEVPGEVHSRFSNSDAIPLHQMIAKNAGVRRARGEFVLATNLDIIFSAELVQFLSARRLERRVLYRIDRYDVASDIPAPSTAEQLLAYCGDHMLRVFDAAGGFELEKGGVRALETSDIVAPDAGIRFGPGCYPVYSDGHTHFRWIANEAEIAFKRGAGTARRLLLDAETGPSAGRSSVDVQVIDPAGAILASARLKGRCQLRLHIPDQLSSARLRLRTQSDGVPLERDSRFLNLRLFGLRWEESPDSCGMARQTYSESTSESGIRVRSVQAGQVQLELKAVAGARLDSLETKISDTAGNTLFQLSADPLQLSQAREYLLTLNLGFKLTGDRASDSERGELSGSSWLLEVIGMSPEKDWSREFEAPSPYAGDMRNAAHLHTNACGDFTLLSRADWHALRGYAELPIWPMHIDSLFCYAAHHAGIREIVLREPMRIFHIEHLSGAGWTPEGVESLNERVKSKGVRRLHSDEEVKWVDQMRRFNAPAIFTRQNWGLGDAELAETVFSHSQVKRLP